jgi:hypothetical protein
MTAAHVLTCELRLPLARLAYEEERRADVELVEAIEIRVREVVWPVVERERDLAEVGSSALDEARARDCAVHGIPGDGPELLATANHRGDVAGFSERYKATRRDGSHARFFAL